MTQASLPHSPLPAGLQAASKKKKKKKKAATVKAAPKKSPASKATAKAPVYTPGRYTATKVLSGRDHVIASRFSYGITPSLVSEVGAAGGGVAWFENQLSTAYDPSHDVAQWWPETLAAPSDPLVRKSDTDNLAAAYCSWLLARRIMSPRPVLERVTELWENHLHVPSRPGAQVRYRAEYGRLIRAGALGKFSDLLINATQHPAMQIYLTNSGSTKAHPNENLGRELLELHTVGVGNYTEDDVKNSARLLTGFAIDSTAATEPRYLPANHWVGHVTVMSAREAWPAPFVHPNTAPDGRPALVEYLTYLARHPATAHRIAQKLAMVFVADAPPAALVAELVEVYLASDTAIVPVLQHLVRSDHLTRYAGTKLRDPAHDLVAMHRHLDSKFTAQRGRQSAVNLLFRQLDPIGAGPMTWASPNGAPLVAGPWATPVRALVSADFHYNAAGRWFPTTDLKSRQPTDFMPKASMEFRGLVDHLSRLFLGRPSDSGLLESCCIATGKKPTEVVKRSGLWLPTTFPDLALVFFDHPHHYHH